MKIIYVGYFVDQNEIAINPNISIAGNNLEKGILGELNKNSDIYIYSIKPIAPYPKDNRIFIKNLKNDIEGISVNNIGYINIQILKHLTIFLNLFIKLFIQVFNLKIFQKERVVIINYNSFPIISLPSIIISRVFNVKILCLVIDIPIIIIKKGNKLKEKLKRMYNDLSLFLFKKYNGMISLVEQTVIDFAPRTPFICIKYAFESNNYKFEKNVKHNETFDIVYTGALEEYYGINEMIETIKILPENYILNLYGNGSLVDFIENESVENSRIQYHGVVSHDQAKKAQQEADLLILLRTEKSINRYSFPSKILEYVASGVPIISSQIESIPSDLNVFINYISSEEPYDLAKKILEIKNEEREVNITRDNYNEGINYLKKEYTWTIQAKRILDFISTI